MYKITIALTIYKQSYNEICRWVDYFDDLRNRNLKNLQILIISDNPNLPEYYKKYPTEKNFEILNNGKNLKRTKLIKEYIDNNIIEGDFLYLCDPDDYFNVDLFVPLYEEIISQKTIAINIHDVKLYKGKNRLCETTIKDWELRSEKWNSAHNFNSFYITEDIRQQELLNSFNLCDDMYWFSISCSKGRKMNFVKSSSPYYWSETAGESNAAFEKKGKKFKIYNDLDKFYEMVNFTKEMIRINNYKNNYYIIGRWVVKSAQNNLIASRKINKHFSLKALILMIKYMKKMKLIYNDDNQKLTKRYKFKLYWLTLFGRKI